MNILVINGSPKGDNSITLQTVLYLEKLHTEHCFHILNVGAKIKSLEKDFTPAVEAIQNADVLLFSYPVYTFIAPCQLHRFIELLKEHQVNVCGKIATQITTSKHFYDVTAHRYIQDNAQELGMNFIRKVRRKLLIFGNISAGALIKNIMNRSTHIQWHFLTIRQPFQLSL